jgi:hypothetical protein
MEKAIKEVLSYLFDGYKQYPGSLFDISPVVDQFNIDAHEMGSLLFKNGWVKNQQFLPTDFRCTISMAGIENVAPEYIEEHFLKITSSIGIIGGKQSLMEILDFPPEHFQKAFDLAKSMEAI